MKMKRKWLLKGHLTFQNSNSVSVFNIYIFLHFHISLLWFHSFFTFIILVSLFLLFHSHSLSPFSLSHYFSIFNLFLYPFFCIFFFHMYD
ncbi:hypothetical protein Lalb_Chr20g0115941 [Lupinus albus]|uniref:Uncharacterized protein n=1 Tax=Lupinus albus TaxID=3870 RepID=A0A6A4NGJ3_LUPAL|nr:hypothetical protein Lalb_Chr20g0115941 [Lupinus albus]